MTKYSCPRCRYNTDRLSYITKHYHRKTPCNPIHSMVSIESLLLDLPTEKETKNSLFQCNYCDSAYKNKSHKYRHQKTCKNKPQDDKVVIKKDDLNTLIADIKEIKEQIKSQVPTNITNNNINVDNSIRIKYVKKAIIQNIDKSAIFKIQNGQKKYSDFMIDCLMRREDGIMDMIKAIYFNEDYPKNCIMAMDHQDAHDNTMKIFDGEDWFKEVLPNVMPALLNYWGDLLDDCYEVHSNDIQRKFSNGNDDYETIIASRTKRLDLEGFISYLKDNAEVKEILKQCLIRYYNIVEKIHGYAPVATID